jgi:hypothetical protein
MKLLERLGSLFRRPRSGSPEDRAAAEEAARIRDEVASTRLSTTAGSAAENYQTGRKPHR